MVTTLASPPGPWLSRISDGASIVCDSNSHVTRGLGLPKSNRHQAQLRNRVVEMTRGVQFDSISLIDRFSQSLGKEIETKFFANVRWNVWKSLEIWFIPLLKFIFSEIIILRRYSISESFAFSNFNRYDRWIVYFDQKGVSFLRKGKNLSGKNVYGTKKCFANNFEHDWNNLVYYFSSCPAKFTQKVISRKNRFIIENCKFFIYS